MTARARITDPATSHLAAASVRVTEHEQYVLRALRLLQRATDEAIYHCIRAKGIKISPSSARSRRIELERRGYVRAAGIGTTESGRHSTAWMLTEMGARTAEAVRAANPIRRAV